MNIYKSEDIKDITKHKNKFNMFKITLTGKINDSTADADLELKITYKNGTSKRVKSDGIKAALANGVTGWVDSIDENQNNLLDVITLDMCNISKFVVSIELIVSVYGKGIVFNDFEKLTVLLTGNEKPIAALHLKESGFEDESEITVFTFDLKNKRKPKVIFTVKKVM